MPEKFPIVLSKSQRGALLLLLSFLFLIPALRLSDAERITEGQIQDRYADFQRLWKPLESNQKEPRVQSFTYNPNYLTDYRAYRLGIPTQAYDRLMEHRAQGRFVNSIEEFQQVTAVSDSLLKVLESQFRFPNFYKTTVKKRPLQKQDLNTATAASLEKINGIGPVLSQRILKYRKRLAGFSTTDQCYEVYGLDSLVVARLLQRFEIQTPPSIQKLDLNKATLKELRDLPYLDEEDARKIVSYRTQNNGITLSILSELFVNYPNKLERIKLYLH